MDTLIITGERVLLALDWNDYLAAFVPIDGWNPFDGDSPPADHPRGFTREEGRLEKIAEAYGKGSDVRAHLSFGSLHDAAPKLGLLRRLLAVNPAMQSLPLDFGPFLAPTPGVPALHHVTDGFFRFLRKLASGEIVEADLMDHGVDSSEEIG